MKFDYSNFQKAIKHRFTQAGDFRGGYLSINSRSLTITPYRVLASSFR